MTYTQTFRMWRTPPPAPPQPPPAPPPPPPAPPPIDLGIDVNTYGKPIPYSAGDRRLTGQLIWIKGGALFSSDGVTARATFAVSFGRPLDRDGTRSYTGLWFNGKKVYDVEEGLDAVGCVWRNYPGSHTQLQDEAIVADLGVTLAPAFRGTMYAVFEDVDLTPYGNQLVSVTARIVDDPLGAPTTDEIEIGVPDAVHIGRCFGVDWTNGWAFFVTDPGGHNIHDGTVRVYDLDTGLVIDSSSTMAHTVQWGPLQWGMYLETLGDFLLGAESQISVNTSTFCIVRANTIVPGTSWDDWEIVYNCAQFLSYDNEAHFHSIAAETTTGGTTVAYAWALSTPKTTSGNKLRCIKYTPGVGISVIWTSTANVDGLQAGTAYDFKAAQRLALGRRSVSGDTEIYLTLCKSGSSGWTLYRATTDGTSAVTLTEMVTLTPAAMSPAATLGTIAYIAGTDRILVGWSQGTITPNTLTGVEGYWLVNRDGSIHGTYSTTNSRLFIGDSGRINDSGAGAAADPDFGEYGDWSGLHPNTKIGTHFMGSPWPRNFVHSVLEIATGVVTNYSAPVASILSNDRELGRFVFNSSGLDRIMLFMRGAAAIRTAVRVDLGTIGVLPGARMLLRNLITLFGEASSGYLESEFTFVGVDEEIDGAVFTTDWSLMGLLEALHDPFGFEFYDGGPTIKVVRKVPLGSSYTVDITIPYDDLIGLDEDTGVQTSRNAEADQISIFELSYVDRTIDFQASIQRARTRATPSPKRDSISLPIVMTASEALTYAHRALLRRLAARVAHRVMAPPRYMASEPTDIIRFTTAGGKVYTTLALAVTLNSDNSIEIVEARNLQTAEGWTLESVGGTLPNIVIPGAFVVPELVTSTTTVFQPTVAIIHIVEPSLVTSSTTVFQPDVSLVSGDTRIIDGGDTRIIDGGDTRQTA